MPAAYLDQHAEASNVPQWEPGVFKSKLAAFGFSLLLGENEAVFEVMTPRERNPDGAKLKQLVASVAGSAW